MHRTLNLLTDGRQHYIEIMSCAIHWEILLLLPSKENTAIGGDSWEKKRRFYLALTEATVEGQAKRIAEAKAAGIGFSKPTQQLLENGDRLPLLDVLRRVKRWDEDIVQKRSENVAQLCWDILWPWLN